MENKYYTPEIEEFHIGFEYETNYLSKDWEKRTLKISDADWFFDTYYQDATAIEFRVKHLDQEDIIKCGWKKYSKFENNYKLTINYNDFQNVFILYYDEIYNTYCISNDEAYELYAQYFLGNIKNKSELKKIMQMLNIQNNAK